MIVSRFAFLWLVSATCWASPAESIVLEGVDVPVSIESPGGVLPLVGHALQTATFLKVKVLVGALYSKEKSPDKLTDAQTDKTLRIVFLKNLSAKTLSGKWSEKLRKLCEGDCSWMKDSLDQLPKTLRETRKEEPLQIHFAENGITLQYPGQSAGGVKIGDARFSRLFSQMWFGNNPIDEGLRDRLLGKR